MKQRFAILIFIIVLPVSVLFSQGKLDNTDVNEDIAQELSTNRDSYKKIFYAIEKGINESNVGLFSGFFDKQVYINLRNAENGYFSASQVYFILENFLTAHKPLSFSFSTYGSTDDIPFATGRGIFRHKGNKELFQIYIALIKLNGKWVIDKINFY